MTFLEIMWNSVQIDWRGILIIALIFIPLEHILPLHAEQKTLRKGWLNDVFYLLFNAMPIKLCFMVILVAAMATADAVVPATLHAAVLAQPLWLQVIEVIIIADLGFYIAHRTFHAVPWLWRFHSVHHSIEEMDWLAAHRVHPVDQIITMVASLLPVYILGFSPLAIAVYALIYHWQSLLIHSNVKLDFGPLKWLVASPQFHHWHHANEKHAYDKNFAGQLPIIDAIAGTLHMPSSMPKAYGCDDPVPALYHQQMIYPLLPLVKGTPERPTEQEPQQV
jgi:sterol desaturase/sphingolipid hydroxylase (fatty acid hydroxylase superfamily)